jgi:hypothetical protein
MRRVNWLAVFLVLFFFRPLWSQTALAQAEARVESLLKQLTLEQKIDLIGGSSKEELQIPRSSSPPAPGRLGMTRQRKMKGCQPSHIDTEALLHPKACEVQE